MCVRPITQDGKTFACRSCDECVAVRRSGWVARAMAEKATSKHAICVTLTYGEDTQEQRDGAKMFAYVDVRKFIHRVTSACRFIARKERHNQMPRVRFLCAGEQGDRNGRCHWHLIIYSDLDLTSVGKFTLRGREITDPGQMWTVGKRKRRLHWSLWPHGFVTLQQPDQGAMHYVLSYCLKDQFTIEKSQDTGRFATAENFATGLFKMSKKPPIGSEWLIAILEDLEKQNGVLPSLNLKVPEMSGYWYPGGLFREKLLWHLVALNQRAVWATGANAPQWASLLASCSDNPKDMEILNGPETEEIDHLGVRLARIAADEAASREEAAGDAFAGDERFYRLSPSQCEALGLRPYQDAQGRIRFACQRGEERGGADVTKWSASDLAILNAGAPLHARLVSNWREWARRSSGRPDYMQSPP